MIQHDVIEQLKWNPKINASEIGVSVHNGIVTLSGQLDTYEKKLEAEKEAAKVFGVKAIAEDIQIGVSLTSTKTDSEIAESVTNAFNWHTSIPSQQVKIKVENGIVTLSGEVDWHYQRRAAYDAVSKLFGVRLVLNNITIKPQASSTDIKDKICAAFQRSATIEAKKIHVDVRGGRITLSGQVRSDAERKEAENAVWQAQGVFRINNNLEVEPERELA